MKTKEDITRRINELKKVKPSDDYEIAYLEIALQKDEMELLNLFYKYSFELQEDIAIIKALRWVLEKDWFEIE